MPAQPKHAFSFENCGDMLGKLKRELGRVAAPADDAHELTDHGINFALTAWHLVDWVWWQHFEDDADRQNALVTPRDPLRTKRNANSGKPPRWFSDHLKERCSELGICQDIANGSKHYEIVKYNPKVAKTTVSASVTSPFVLGVSKLGEAALDGPVTSYRLKVQTTRGEPEKAIPLFDAVTGFWDEFLRERGIS